MFIGVEEASFYYRAMDISTDNFDKLERKVERLLELCDALRCDKDELRELLRRRDIEISELRGAAEVFEKEKGAVRERVDGLIERLDGLIQSA